ncbi:2-dehydro-3-deoxygalactonokinase [Hyphomonas sp.]|uniref:2-dehydro-3-deoxygalactonokinase n=1 Tax=Hyphomonas sp. TaxID=87 RepID=UPI00391CEF56
MAESLALIGLDWNGTRLSGWAFDAEGEVLGAFSALEARRPELSEYLPRTHFHLGEWIGSAIEVPVIACGDIGLLAPESLRAEMRLPVAATEAARLFETAGVHVVPWVWQGEPADVSGGAETMLAGLGEDHGAICLAGRLTRHVQLAHGRIVRIATEMTAELRDLYLTGGTLALGPDQAQAFDERVFRDWVEMALDTGEPVPVFAVEAAVLSGRLHPRHKAAAVAGLLIGRDVATHYDPGDEVVLVADGPLLEAYGLAFDCLGAEVEEASAEGVLQDGLVELADLAGLLGED